MKILTEEEFWAYNEKNPGRFPDVPYVLNKLYRSASSRRRRYFQYVERMKDKENKLQEKMSVKPDEKALSFRDEVVKRDGSRCQLVKCLTAPEYVLLRDNAGEVMKSLDVAHIKSRGSAPEKKWNINNVLLLNRYSHSMLDQGKHPLCGVSISVKERAEWWDRIITSAGLKKQESIPDAESTEKA